MMNVNSRLDSRTFPHHTSKPKMPFDSELTGLSLPCKYGNLNIKQHALIIAIDIDAVPSEQELNSARVSSKPNCPKTKHDTSPFNTRAYTHSSLKTLPAEHERLIRLAQKEAGTPCRVTKPRCASDKRPEQWRETLSTSLCFSEYLESRQSTYRCWRRT